MEFYTISFFYVRFFFFFVCIFNIFSIFLYLPVINCVLLFFIVLYCSLLLLGFFMEEITKKRFRVDEDDQKIQTISKKLCKKSITHTQNQNDNQNKKQTLVSTASSELYEFFHAFLTKDPRLCSDIYLLVNLLWKLKSCKKYVPCASPSSLFRKDIQEHLFSKPYVVSAKCDGIRAFLLLGNFNDKTNEEYGVFLDRAYNVYKVQTFADPRFYDGTFLDGEVVFEKSGKCTFVVFDAITVCGYNMRKKPFYKRKNKYEEAIQHISVKGIKLTPKEWYPLSFSAKIWNSRKTSSFAADGLIFQPLNTQLTHGVQKDVFKWKPNHTVDFYLSSLHTKQGESDYSWLLEIGDGPRIINASPEFNITLEFRDLCSERKLLERCSSHGRIVVECFMEIDNDSSTWTAIPQCIRADKGTANDKFVVTRTLLNIKENITVEELVCKDF